MMRNIAIVKMSTEIFREVFFPIATEILSVDFVGGQYQNDQYISILVEHPDLPSVEIGEITPIITPVYKTNYPSDDSQLPTIEFVSWDADYWTKQERE